MMLCTQNVDALHEAAGSKRVFHMHGCLFQSRCSNPSCPSEPFEDTKTYEQRAEIPVCGCGALIRPHICWFGESPFHMEDIFPALGECSIFLTVGSSGMVQPAASFATIARQHGATTFYVGPEAPANAFAFDEIVLGPAGRELPGLFR